MSQPVRRTPRLQVGWLIAGISACVLAAIMIAGGAWALWMDRIQRDESGFLSVATTRLDTSSYAIVGDLWGDGPRWLYGSTVLGNARVRVTAQGQKPIFIGIAPTSDVFRYLDGTGYSTIKHLESGSLATQAGRAPSVAPQQISTWAASVQGTGEQTLLWKPRAGDWSIVLMNTDASGGVSLRGDLAAKIPLLPWLAVGPLIVGAAVAAFGAWSIVHGLRARRATSESEVR